LRNLIVDGNCVRIKPDGIAYQFTTHENPEVTEIKQYCSNGEYGHIVYKTYIDDTKVFANILSQMVWYAIREDTITFLKTRII